MSTKKYNPKKVSSKYTITTSFTGPSYPTKSYGIEFNEEKKEETLSSVASSATTSSSSSILPEKIPRIHTKEHPPLRSEYAILSYNEYRNLEKGNGGFQGVVPWFVDQNGVIQYVLNISKKYKLLSYIGGGLRKGETPIDSLYREIEEETPQWSDYLIGLLENPLYPRLVVLKDEYYPDRPHKNPGHIRLSTTIYLRIDPMILNETTFQSSKEVDRLYIIPLDELPFYIPVENYAVTWKGTENGLSNGVNDMVEMIMDPTLYHYLWVYIKNNITKAEYISYLKWMYETNQIENKMLWENRTLSPQRSTSNSTRTSTQVSSKKKSKGSSKKSTRKKSKKRK